MSATTIGYPARISVPFPNLVFVAGPVCCVALIRRQTYAYTRFAEPLWYIGTDYVECRRRAVEISKCVGAGRVALQSIRQDLRGNVQEVCPAVDRKTVTRLADPDNFALVRGYRIKRRYRCGQARRTRGEGHRKFCK